MGESQRNELIEKICEANQTILSPIEGNNDEIFFSGHDGYIYQYKEGKLKQIVEVGGQPNGLAIDPSTNICYIADIAHQSILAKNLDDKSPDITQIVSEFEGQPLEGPNSLILDSEGKYLYFTDSGVFGESNLENKQGSVFMVDLEDSCVTPLALRCLAGPSDLCFSPNEKLMYVAETFANRILKFYTDEESIQFTVFYQMSGRLGPVSLSVNNEGLIFVAHYEKMNYSMDGNLKILSPEGEKLQSIFLPNYPEINGMNFSKVAKLTPS
jgi:sugar lactone lactonase YvrE